MRLITFQEPFAISIRRSTGIYKVVFQPFANYIISNRQFKSLVAAKAESKFFKVSDYDGRLVGFNVKGLKPGEKILLWNGSGGIGDQIMTWPVAKILDQLGFEVHVAAEIGLEMCWWNFPFVKSIVQIPAVQVHLDSWQNKAFVEAAVNLDEHTDQLHPTDTMLRRFGIDPGSIEPARKQVAPIFTPGEEEEAIRTLGGTQSLAIYQLTASVASRSLSQSQSIGLVHTLAVEFPNLNWLAIYDKFISSETLAEAETIKLPNFRLMSFENLRLLWALVAQSVLCVGPDSMLVHVAGSLGIPCIGLWGYTPPDKRVSYYSNHFSIWHPEKCPHAPCYNNDATSFPSYCPPTAEPRTACAVMAAIRPEEVVAMIRRL